MANRRENSYRVFEAASSRAHSNGDCVFCVILTKRATRADGRISDSGAQAPPVPVLSSESDKNQDRCAISETGTGFADAKLSEILPSARVARFVRMTSSASGSAEYITCARRTRPHA